MITPASLVLLLGWNVSFICMLMIAPASLVLLLGWNVWFVCMLMITSTSLSTLAEVSAVRVKPLRVVVMMIRDSEKSIAYYGRFDFSLWLFHGF